MKHQWKRSLKKVTAAVLSATLAFGVATAAPLTTFAEEKATVTRVEYLSDYNWKSATQGSSDSTISVQKDKTCAGSPLTLVTAVNGSEYTTKVYEKGIGTHAASEIVYNIDGKNWTKFEAYVGTDYSQKQDSADEGRLASFKVYADGVEIASTTGDLTPITVQQHLEAVIPAGTKELKLKVDQGKQNWSDHADWADAKITRTLPDPQNAAVNVKPVLKTKAGGSVNINPDNPASMITDGVVPTNLGGTGVFCDFGTDNNRQSIYVQLDLSASLDLAGINMWRYWLDGRTYDATVVAVSDDKDFAVEKTTVLYNSDTSNVHGFGAGTDPKYAETNKGKQFPVAADQVVKARYVRVYTYGVKNGGTTNHIVEIQAMVYDPENAVPVEPEKLPMEHATEPLDIKSYCVEQINGPNQTTHPDVLYFPEKWNGYEYWMSFTPNNVAASNRENPSIAASHDGVNWVYPAKNPIEPEPDPSLTNVKHNCDADLVYNEKENRLYVYWNYGYDAGANNGQDLSWIKYRSSSDGVDWSTTETVINSKKKYNILSPSIVFDKKDNLWKMWSVDTSANGGGDGGWTNQTNKVELRTSADGKDWSEPQSLATTFVQEGYIPWHMEVQYIESKDEFWAIFPAYRKGSNSENTELFFARSKDGINWKTYDKPLLGKGKAGAFDDKFIYRSTFVYHPDTDVFELWYGAGSKDHGVDDKAKWKIGHSSNTLAAMMKSFGDTIPTVMRHKIDNENPVIIHHLQREFNSNLPGPIQGGHNIREFWDNLPEKVKPYQALVLHGGYYLNNNYEVRGLTQEAFYRQQAEICTELNIPFFVMIANSYTSNIMPKETVEDFFQKYPTFLGVAYSECSGKNFANDVAEKLEVCSRYGGYVWFADQKTQENFTTMLNTTSFVNAAKQYSDNMILMHKSTTPNSSNTGTNAAEANVEGAWLAGLSGNWGTLIDSWMWYIDGYWKLYESPSSIASGGAEEGRTAFAMPDQLFAYRMIQEGMSGATVFTFEHPFDSTGIRNTFTPAYTDVVVKATEFLINAKIPTREEVAAKTKVAYTSEAGNVNGVLTASPIYNALMGDKGGSGYYKAMLTKSTGRYGIIPVIPASVSTEFKEQYEGKMDFINDTYCRNNLNTKEKILAYFNERYPETYTGSGYAEKLDNQWFTYNNLWESKGKQNVSLPMEGGFADSIDIGYDNFTYLLVTDEAGKVSVKLNNYLLDKDDIWDGYVKIDQPNGSVHWDSDNNLMWPNYLWRSVIPNEFRLDEDYRNTTVTLKGLEAEPKIVVTDGMYDDYNKKAQYTISDGVWDAAAGTYSFQIDANGWVEFDVLPKTASTVADTGLTLTNDTAVAHAAGAEETPFVTTENGSISKITLKMMDNFDYGQSFTLNANVQPAGAANQTVTWESSDWGVATVAEGKVIAKHPGTATITATTAGGSKKTVEVEVLDVPEYVTGVKFFQAQNGITGVVSPSDVTVKVDGTVALVANTTPAMAKNNRVTYEVADPTLASVTADGVVKGLKAGETTVTVTTVDGGFTDTCKLTVAAKGNYAVPVTGLTVSDTELTMKMGEGVEITTTAAPSNATLGRVVWSSDDKSIAEISDDGIVGRAMVLAKGAGTTILHAYTVDGGYEATITVTVQGKAPVKPVDKTKLKASVDDATEQAKNLPQYLIPIIKRQFTEALKNANDVYADPEATQALVNAADAQLIKIMQYLSFTADPTGIQEAIAAAEALIASDKYEDDDAMTAYRDLLQAAKDVLAAEDSMTEDFDGAIAALVEAEKNLHEKAGLDLELLQYYYDIAKDYDLSKYLDLGTTKADFTAARDVAKTLLDAPTNQDAIDAATVALHTAMLNLRLIPNKDALKELLDEANAKDLSLYTKSSGEALQAAIQVAKAVYDNPLADQQAVDEANAILAKAIDGLQPAETGGEGDTPKTGDSDNFVMLVVVLAISMLAVTVLFKKRKENLV